VQSAAIAGRAMDLIDSASPALPTGRSAYYMGSKK